jgi:hypothetical protein
MEVWHTYRALIQSATIQTLPTTVQSIEERIKSDVELLEKRGSEKDVAGSAQARKSAYWLNTDLRTYLAQLPGR